MRKISPIFVLLLASIFGSAQTLITSFNGDTGTASSGTPTYKNHPDMGLGANGTYVMEATGQNILIYNYAGVQQSSTATGTFITNAGLTVGTVNDPRVIYDNFISRWLVVCSCSKDYLIVSSGSDPTTSTWKGVNLTTETGDLGMRVGYDKNWVYIGEFDSITGGGTQREIAIPQADVAWSGGGNVSLTHEVSSGGHTLDAFPEIDLNNSKGTTDLGYFVSRVGEAQTQTNAALTLAIDTFTPSSSTAGTFSAAGSPTTIATIWLYNTPVQATQPSSPNIAGTESHRPFEVFAANGTDLHAVFSSGPCASSCGSQPVDTQDIFFWFDVAIPALTLTQSAEFHDSALSYLFPSMAVDATGNVLFSATGTSSSQAASVYSWYHLTTNSAGVLNGPTRQVTGSQTYNCQSSNPVGWGTYSFMVQDPGTTANVWGISEYGSSASSCQWQTSLFEMHVPVTPPPPGGSTSTPSATILAEMR